MSPHKWIRSIRDADGKEVFVEVFIDVDAIARRLGPDAASSYGGKATVLYGAVTVKKMKDKK